MHLQRLRNARTLHDVARLLIFTPSGLSYVLYKTPESLKYRHFDIPKRNGGKRHIKAPQPELELLQRRLAKLLYDCLQDLITIAPNRRSLAHGFELSRSIITNASLHKRRRYILNIDLEDFFPSINFGRVRGFFIKDKYFSLNDKVATTIAQIACHENELPQGSPCSPVISNLVGHILDTRLARLAKEHKCTYSRYVDDITFSTNRKDFPAELAIPVPSADNEWRLGDKLLSKIENSGFKINKEKTRMQIRGSRQVVTGLVVNDKVNVCSEYYRTARSMCHKLFSSGNCYRMVPSTLRNKSADSYFIKEPVEINQLEGILSHVYHVKNTFDIRTPLEKKKQSTSMRKLYKRFLFYKSFIGLDAPLILPEGNTDTIYLKSAIHMLPRYHPRLGEHGAEKFVIHLHFMRYSHIVHDVMQLGGRTGDLKQFIMHYRREINSFKHTSFAFPVIIVVDNDDGSKDIFSTIKNNFGLNISHHTTEPFYYICHNLYLVKTPEMGNDKKSCIEDLFDQNLLQTKIDGKVFDPEKEHEAHGKYGKIVFAEKIVRPNRATINFSRFELLLDRLVAVLDHYAHKQLMPVTAAL